MGPLDATRSLARGASLALLLVSVAAAPAAAQINGFDWTLTGNPGGSGVIGDDTLFVIGPDIFGSCTPQETYFETSTPVAAEFEIRIDWYNPDPFGFLSGPVFDAPAFVLNGETTLPAEVGFGWPTGDYLFSGTLAPGDVFGFGSWSLDCYNGAGEALYYDFEFDTGDWIDAGGALDPREKRSFEATTGGVGLGSSVAALGDLDGDGIGDVAIGAPDIGSGRVRVLSGASGALLLDLSGEPGSGRFGHAVSSAGDANGDDVPDVAVGDPNDATNGPDAGRVAVFSGVDGALIHELFGNQQSQRLGFSVDLVGDVDGDGRSDIVAGRPSVAGSALPGRALVLSGFDFSVLHDVVQNFTSLFAYSVAGIGDADGDAVPDFAVGEPDSEDFALGGFGRVYWYSGADGSLIESVAFSVTGMFGYAVSRVGDVDGDGLADVLAGAPNETFGELTGAGAAVVLSGTSGLPIEIWYGTAPGGRFGAALDGGRDVDGDGAPDFAVGSPFELEGSALGVVRVYRATDGALLHEILGESNDEFGAAVAMSEDIDGDGLPDVIAGAPTGGPAGGGAARVFGALDGPGAPRLQTFGFLLANSALMISVDDAASSAPAYLVIGASQLNAPFRGGLLVPSPDLVIPVATDVNGAIDLAGTWPAGVPTGAEITFQVWIQDREGPAGFTATNARVAIESGDG